MTTSIMLINWTDQGARKADRAPQRLEAAGAMLEDMAGSNRSVDLTLGGYDLVAIVEAPDDAVIARFTLQLGMPGNVRTQTLKAKPAHSTPEPPSICPVVVPPTEIMECLAQRPESSVCTSPPCRRENIR